MNNFSVFVIEAEIAFQACKATALIAPVYHIHGGTAYGAVCSGFPVKNMYCAVVHNLSSLFNLIISFTNIFNFSNQYYVLLLRFDQAYGFDQGHGISPVHTLHNAYFYYAFTMLFLQA